MKILHIHRVGGIGGSERHLLALLPALAARGADVAFLGLDDPRGDAEPVYAELEQAGIPCSRLPAPRDLDPALAVRAARAVRSQRPDIVHTHLVHADVYGALAAAAGGAALVSTKHNDDPFRAGTFRHVDRLLARRAASVICITDSLARFNAVRVGIPPDKLVVIHYGLDAPPARWGENPEIELPPGARLLLGIGRLAEQKGYETAIRALPQILSDEPRAVLVVLGEGPERGRLEALARDLGVEGALLLPGRAGDVSAWLGRAELFVHPCRWEGFGLVLLEAMLAGLPIVASEVSSVPEIVSDGETGLLVPPGEPDAFARAVTAVLADPARRGALGEAGRTRAHERFSVARMAERTLEVYSAAQRR